MSTLSGISSGNSAYQNAIQNSWKQMKQDLQEVQQGHNHQRHPETDNTTVVTNPTDSTTGNVTSTKGNIINVKA